MTFDTILQDVLTFLFSFVGGAATHFFSKWALSAVKQATGNSVGLAGILFASFVGVQAVQWLWDALCIAMYGREKYATARFEDEPSKLQPNQQQQQR